MSSHSLQQTLSAVRPFPNASPTFLDAHSNAVVVMIDRDYGNAHYTTFRNELPDEFRERGVKLWLCFWCFLAFWLFVHLSDCISHIINTIQITEEEFQFTIDHINGLLLRAETIDAATVAENFLVLFSCFTLYYCKQTRFNKVNGHYSWVPYWIDIVFARRL